MEANFESEFLNEDNHNTKNTETNAFDGTLKEYEDILVCLYGLPIKNFNRNLLLPNENTEIK